MLATLLDCLTGSELSERSLTELKACSAHPHWVEGLLGSSSPSRKSAQWGSARYQACMRPSLFWEEDMKWAQDNCRWCCRHAIHEFPWPFLEKMNTQQGSHFRPSAGLVSSRASQAVNGLFQMSYEWAMLLAQLTPSRIVQFLFEIPFTK